MSARKIKIRVDGITVSADKDMVIIDLYKKDNKQSARVVLSGEFGYLADQKIDIIITPVEED